MNKAPEKFLRPTFSSTNEKGMQSSEDHRDPTKSEKERKFRRNLQNFDAAPSRSVVLRDLPFCCTSKDLQNFIAEHLGVPPDVAVVLRNPDGKTLQYGCALFSSDEHAAQALERVHLRRLHGRDIRVLPYSSAALREVSRSGDVLISFISLSAMVESITEQNIRNIVEEYGDIDYIAIRHHKFSKEGMQNGFGFVTMTSQEENRRVLDNVKGIEVDNVIYTSEESNQLRRGQPKTVDPDQLDDASEAAHVPSPLKAQKSIDSDKLSSSSVKTDTSQVSPRAENTPNEVTMHQQSPVPDNIRSSAAISRPSSRTNISREPIISTVGPSSHPNYPSSYHQSGTPYQQSIAQNQTIVVDPSSNTYHHPALMTYQPPRPYSPSSISASSNSHNQTYISSISSHHMQGNPSVGGSPVLSSMSGQMLTSYPTQPPQFSAPYPPGVPVYSTGQPQQSVPSYHSPQMNASAHNRYHVAPPLQYSMAVNVPQAQPLPPQSLNSPPGYQYAMPMDSNPPTYVMSTFPHSSQQGSPAHAPPSSSNPHQHHLPLVPRHQPSSSPYLHVAVPQNGMNVPVVSIVPVPSAQSHHVSTYPNGQLMTPSSVAPNNASVSYPLQYSNQTNAYHMGHHAMQTPIYQQQHHHPQFVSQPQPNHSTHAYHHHPPQQDQQRR